MSRFPADKVRRTTGDAVGRTVILSAREAVEVKKEDRSDAEKDEDGARRVD